MDSEGHIFQHVAPQHAAFLLLVDVDERRSWLGKDNHQARVLSHSRPSYQSLTYIVPAPSSSIFSPGSGIFRFSTSTATVNITQKQQTESLLGSLLKQLLSG